MNEHENFQNWKLNLEYGILKNCLKMEFLVKINKWNNDNNNENNT